MNKGKREAAKRERAARKAEKTAARQGRNAVPQPVRIEKDSEIARAVDLRSELHRPEQG